MNQSTFGIYTTGLIGYETAKNLFVKQEDLYRRRFPDFFIREFLNLPINTSIDADFLGNFCIEKNTKNHYISGIYSENGGVFSLPIGSGGIYAALWEACENMQEIFRENGIASFAGCTAAQDLIPIEQHVLEFLELSDENPYEVSSEGCFLIVADENSAFARSVREQLLNEGSAPAAWIGEVTTAKERVICGLAGKRFLTPPARQQKDIADRKKGDNA